MKLAIVLAMVVTACSPAIVDAPIVDGWPVGGPKNCRPEDRCDELLTEAIRGLGERDPGHPAIVEVTLHVEGAIRRDDGRVTVFTRSGACCTVAVFELADGSTRAIGVGYPGISQTPVSVPHGP